jgi:hypothetical protein
MTVSTTRPVATLSAPPTASTSIALIGTSDTSAPSRSSRPRMRDPATAMPRLHQVSGTSVEMPTATRTPTRTLTTRRRPVRNVS